MPLYGVLVPFHITTVKSVALNQDNDHSYVRLSFNFRCAVWYVHVRCLYAYGCVCA